jgi:hypothetical protein
MTIKRTIASGAGIFGANTRKEQWEVAGKLAEAIHTQFTVANILVWENVATGVQHWREDCPSLRRSKHARSKLLPRMEGMTKACGMCAEVELRERNYARQRRRARILAIPPPAFPELPAVYGKALIVRDDGNHLVRSNPKEVKHNMAATEDAQQAANSLVESAQTIANSVVDLGEEAAATVLGAVIEANTVLGNALKALSEKLVPSKT